MTGWQIGHDHAQRGGSPSKRGDAMDGVAFGHLDGV